ncbi:MAG TPA: glycosyltransferase [Chitinophagales bacterium]|nr:glycosyltransferase [Chitinophagales bacterium]
MERQNTKLSNTKTILIAPLDWGLGHATRCIPLINMLIQKKHRVIIAGNGDSFSLLMENFPTLTFYELPGYNIKNTAGKNAAIQSLLQTPKILRTIKAENAAIQTIAQTEKIDVILSDNRYGVRHPNIKSIFMCHQIALQAPSPFQFMSSIFLKLHLKQIQKFDMLWIPDEEGEENLSGILSHHISFSTPHQYIGIQSRFYQYAKSPSFIDDLDFDILVILSGVEPQRTSLEQALKEKLVRQKQKTLIVQGKTAFFTKTEEGPITTVSYLNTNDLLAAMQKTKSILCRSGYSTVMDLAVLGKKAILIPAEGQTEQEYLAKMLHQKGYAIACTEKNLQLDNAFLQVENCKGFPPHIAGIKKLETAWESLFE